MGRVFTVFGENLTLNSTNVLLSIQSAAAGNAGSILKLLRLTISQNANTTAAQLRAAISKRANAGTFTLTSVTPQNLTIGGPASGISGGTNGLTAAICGVNASVDSSPSYTDIDADNFNNLNGYLWIATPVENIIVPPSTILVARLLAAPGNTAGWTVKANFEEMF